MELIIFIVWSAGACVFGVIGGIIYTGDDDLVWIIPAVLWPVGLAGIIIGIIIALIAEYVFGKEYPKYK